ncbi:energy transducer TonB [Pseudorhodoferax sp. Leaf274]|uniref:energy transducer TonB n=1 Tax=Pseudorhodoferax sp. Leaf274 TaxID=1736318 RepID=UPI0007026054|nr:TonB family protein [Pseudorhodoferax sp. Leaf274]KQP48691.1 energy transducer TonB [Pseudorhodoferax sp. Leaf274]
MRPPGWLRRLSTLQAALLFSVAAHAALLAVRFADPAAFDRLFQDTPLEVILVNAKSDERPDKAQAIAQASLAGGGDAAAGRATSPLPPSPRADIGDAIEQAQRQVEAMHQQQTLLLAQVTRMLAALPPPDPRNISESAEAREQDERRRQLLQHLAEIERRIEIENARPKRRVVSPSTREEVYAVYYDALRRKVEERGTQNFPEHNGRKLYGELVMIITVDHTGQVLSTEVAESSGNRLLDQRAQAIARAAGPYGGFTPAMRMQADQILVVSRFRFARDATLQTNVSTPP